MRRLVVLLLLLLWAVPAGAGRASWSRVGDAGADARARASMGGELVSVDGDGALQVLDLEDGDRATRSAADHTDTRLLFGEPGRLIALGFGGALYDIDASTGRWRQIGERCAWAETVAGVLRDGQLYTIETSGALYATDLAAGDWREVGEARFEDVAAMLADADALYVLDRAGTLWAVEPATGARSRIGDEGANPGAVAAAILGGRLYTVDADGVLRATDLAKGTIKQLAGKLAAVALFASGKRLVAIDAAGTVRARRP